MRLTIDLSCLGAPSQRDSGQKWGGGGWASLGRVASGGGWPERVRSAREKGRGKGERRERERERKKEKKRKNVLVQVFETQIYTIFVFSKKIHFLCLLSCDFNFLINTI